MRDMKDTKRTPSPDIIKGAIDMTTKLFEPDFLLEGILRGGEGVTYVTVSRNRIYPPREPLSKEQIAPLLKAAIEKYGCKQGDIKYDPETGRFSVRHSVIRRIREGLRPK